MSLSDLASLGSFVSGVAVLASLIFLFFQIRQMPEQVKRSEKNQQAAVGQGRAAILTERAKWALGPQCLRGRDSVKAHYNLSIRLAEICRYPAFPDLAQDLLALRPSRELGGLPWLIPLDYRMRSSQPR